MISTEEGIDIDVRDEQPSNSRRTNRRTLEFRSKMTFSREVQFVKQSWPMLSTEARMKIDFSLEHSQNIIFSMQPSHIAMGICAFLPDLGEIASFRNFF
jgi:hypothetical protein